MRKCLLDEITTEACTPHSAIHVGFHGTNGTGGRLGAANIPPDYRHVTVSNSPARADQSKVYTVIDRYIETFSRQFDDDSEPIKSVYLHSEEPGTGKTTTAVAILNAWLVVHYVGSIQRGVQPKQRPGYFLDATEWQTEFNISVMANDEQLKDEFKRKYFIAKDVDFLVIDDIGVRDITQKFRGYIHALVNARVTSGKPTVYTSNVAVDKLPVVFGERRLADRIGDRKLCQTLYFEGKSKRRVR